MRVAVLCVAAGLLEGQEVLSSAVEAGFEEPGAADEGDEEGGAGEDVAVSGVEGGAELGGGVDGELVDLGGGDEVGVAPVVPEERRDDAVGGDVAGVAVGAGAEEGAAVLDGAEDDVGHVLEGAGALVVPGVVGDGGEELRAVEGELA